MASAQDWFHTPTNMSWAKTLSDIVADARDDSELVLTGWPLAPGAVLIGYRAGVFPMPVTLSAGEDTMGWWSPNPRGVLLPGAFGPSRSLRRSARSLRVTANTAFAEVVAGCADPRRDGTWITDDVADVYLDLHLAGWAHSVEVWRDDELVGGLYGVGIGGLFAAESKFHTVTDASKVAFWAMTSIVFDGDPRRLIDVQWQTDHLRTLGVTEMDRSQYRSLVHSIVDVSSPRWPRGPVTVCRPR